MELLEDAAADQGKLALTKAVVEAHELMLEQCVILWFCIRHSDRHGGQQNQAPGMYQAYEKDAARHRVPECSEDTASQQDTY